MEKDKKDKGVSKYKSASGVYAHRLSAKSALLPTSTTITSVPRSDLTSSTHLDVDKKEARSEDRSGLGRLAYGDVRLLTGNVEHDNCHRTIPNVRRNKRPVPFLQDAQGPTVSVRNIRAAHVFCNAPVQQYPIIATSLSDPPNT